MWYRKAAEHGNSTAQHNIGSCYERGAGVACDLMQVSPKPPCIVLC